MEMPQIPGRAATACCHHSRPALLSILDSTSHHAMIAFGAGPLANSISWPRKAVSTTFLSSAAHSTRTDVSGVGGVTTRRPHHQLVNQLTAWSRELKRLSR